MPKLNKTEGENANCPSCKNPMICVLVKGKPKTNEPGKFWDDRLQWQSDGRAHYGFNKETEKSFCVGTQKRVESAVQAIINQKIQLKDIELDMELLDKTLYVTKSACQFLKAIEYGVYEQLGQDANPAHVGEYVKLIADKMLGVPDLQQILEDIGSKDA